MSSGTEGYHNTNGKITTNTCPDHKLFVAPRGVFDIYIVGLSLFKDSNEILR